MLLRSAMIVALLLPVGGCATYSYGTLTPAGSSPVSASVKAPAAILITEGDLRRPYTSLGDIEVTVNKTTIFNQDPTRADIDEALRQKAAAVGADAVVFVRYGSVGISAISWGSLDGRGRAVAYAR